MKINLLHIIGFFFAGFIFMMFLAFIFQSCTTTKYVQVIEQSVTQANFSTKEMFRKNCNQLQEMLMTEKGINWNDTPTKYKRGLCVVEQDDGKWRIDEEIPIFTQDRDYIEKLINF